MFKVSKKQNNDASVEAYACICSCSLRATALVRVPVLVAVAMESMQPIVRHLVIAHTVPHPASSPNLFRLTARWQPAKNA